MREGQSERSKGKTDMQKAGSMEKRKDTEMPSGQHLRVHSSQCLVL
jgi:hypothetical protein